ncbi:MAG: nucleotidyltransferase domain-containing protein [Planctomycetes bacterium]|nr:nucleotidyltransferase domain-containing protein [Planctomycetota bacterium]
MNIAEMKSKILPILTKYDVIKASIFGSVARDETTSKSDIDIAVAIDNDSISLLDIIGMKHELEDALKSKVDIVEFDAIKPALKESILNDQVPIL